MWPNPQETADLLKKSLMENFIFVQCKDSVMEIQNVIVNHESRKAAIGRYSSK